MTNDSAHSYIHTGRKSSYWFANGQFHSGQINMALALSRIGPGDGATRLLPGSHKSNIAARSVPEMAPTEGGTMEGVPGAVSIGLYPIVTLQYSSTTLYQFSYHIR